MASGMIRALRRRYPQAYIAWLTQPGPDALLRANTELDDVLVWRKDAWIQHLKSGCWGQLAGECRALFGRLRRSDFDTVLDAQGLLKSGLWAWLTGAESRLGLGSREGSQHLMTRVIDRPADDARFGSEYIDAAVALGAEAGSFVPHIVVDHDSHRTAVDRLQEQIGNRPFVALAPFTTRPQKHWFDGYWRTLIADLQKDRECAVVILGGPDDSQAGDSLAASSQSADLPSVVSLAGRTSLLETMALIERAELLIGVDTGVTHMGTVAGRPTVALFGSTRPYTEPGTSTTSILYEPLSCAPCQKHPICEGRFTCMAELTPARVLAAARERLEEGAT